MDRVAEARLIAGQGVAGSVDRSRRRQITVLTREAWDACMTELDATIDPSARRANLLVSGMDLANTRNRVLQIGAARLVIGGELTPCERMEEALPGLQAALRQGWRGGVFAQVLSDGLVRDGDRVVWQTTTGSSTEQTPRSPLRRRFSEHST
jgi:MOSC domain-containing protein YiiM